MKNGSYDAFDKIYRIYVRRLYAYCFRFTKSHENSEEIVQDVFVKLWMNREKIKQTDTLCPLIFVIAKHSLINAFRAKVREPFYAEWAHCGEKASINDTGRRIEYAEFVAEFKKAAQTLPPTIREVVTLSVIHELSNREIAEELALSDQTVRNSLSLGLKKLREILSKTHLPCMLLLARIIDLFGTN